MAAKLVSDVTTRPRATSKSRPVVTPKSNEPGSLEQEVTLPAEVPARKVRWTLLLMGLIVLGILGVTGFAVLYKMPKGLLARATVSQPKPVVPAPQAASQPISVTSHLMFVGDVFWGRAIETAAQRSGKGPSNLFRGLTADDKKGYDAWVGDIECPVTDKNIPYRTQVDSLIFNCRPEYTAAAAEWFDIMTLANNHTDNNGGVWGFEQTRANLEKAGMQYFGTYNMKDESDICEVVSVKARPSSGDVFALPVAMCGYDYVGNVIPQESQLQQMEKYANVMPVFAMPHMGVEYRATAEDAKVRLYRQLIDHGADVVIGGHPHVVQNSEVYKGRLIAYSTGNFLFDQQILGRDTTESLGVGVAITMQDQAAIAAYKKVGSGCKVFKDDCLAQLERSIAKRPVIRAAYDFQYFDESSGTPVRASPQVSDLIKTRATVEGLQGLATTW